MTRDPRLVSPGGRFPYSGDGLPERDAGRWSAASTPTRPACDDDERRAHRRHEVAERRPAGCHGSASVHRDRVIAQGKRVIIRVDTHHDVRHRPWVLPLDRGEGWSDRGWCGADRPAHQHVQPKGVIRPIATAIVLVAQPAAERRIDGHLDPLRCCQAKRLVHGGREGATRRRAIAAQEQSYQRGAPSKN